MRIIRPLLASVRVRVTAAALLAVGCALAVAVVAVDASLQHDKEHVLMTTAQYEAREVTDFNPELTPPLVLPHNANIQNGLVQVIRNGKVVGSSPGLHKMGPLWTPGEPVVQTADELLGVGKDVQFVEVPLDTNGIKANVVVVTSLDQYNHSVNFVRRLLLVGMPLLLAVVGVICWMMVGRALRPIEMMRREVDEVATIRGAHRVAEPATDDEVGRLARTLNTMLDRIESSSERERRFVSDASHELRSPIANIRTEIEVALHHPEHADWPAVAHDVLGQNQRMTNLVEGLLLLARSDEGSLVPASGATDLAGVAESVVAQIEARVSTADVNGSGMGDGRRLPSLCVECAPAPVPVPAIYLERMVANLVDNAMRFAADRVEVTVRPEGAFGVLEVTDDGPGVPAPEAGHIFERFVRLDAARDRGVGGFGLGLAIVADLCRHYGGTIRVESAGFPTPGRGPGARFVLRFPLRPERSMNLPIETPRPGVPVLS